MRSMFPIDRALQSAVVFRDPGIKMIELNMLTEQQPSMNPTMHMTKGTMVREMLQARIHRTPQCEACFPFGRPMDRFGVRDS